MSAPGEPEPGVQPRWMTELIVRIQGWAANEPGVLGAAVYGSLARDSADHFSDVDLALVRQEGSTTHALLDSLERGLTVSARLGKDGKEVLYLSEPLVKLEVRVVALSELDALQAHFEGSRIPDPARAILVAKDPGIASRIAAWSRPPGQPPSLAELSREGASFLYYFEEFHGAFHRGDHYRAFFLYSLAFYKLAGFLAGALGQGDSLYSPPQLLTFLRDSAPHWQGRFEACAPEWGHDLSPLLVKKDLLFDLFEEVLSEQPGLPGLTLATARALRLYTRERFPPLWRWRDLGGRGRIVAHRVIRAARLDRYSPTILRPILGAAGVRTLIDLRTEPELSGRARGYSAAMLDGIRYVRIPIEVRTPLPETAPLVERFRLMYEHILEDPSYADWVRAFLEELGRPGSLPLVLHCHGGADRTGWLVATLLDLAGASRTDIVEDYLISSACVREEYILRFLDSLRAYGGAASYLAARGVPASVVESAVRAVTHPPERPPSMK